jgi:hypothetical protein
MTPEDPPSYGISNPKVPCCNAPDGCNVGVVQAVEKWKDIDRWQNNDYLIKACSVGK